MGLVYCCHSTLLSKLTSRGYCLVVGGFSLAVICGLLSSCGRVKHSLAGDSKLVEVFTVLGISGGASPYLPWWAPLYLSQEARISLLCALRSPLERGGGSC